MDWDLFYFKKLVSQIFYPKYLAMILLFLGFLWVFRTKQVAGLFLISAGALSLLVAALPMTGFLLIRPLEIRAGPVPDRQDIIRQNVGSVVVLQDFAEAVEVWKSIPGSRLVISSGDCGTKLVDAARQSGLPDNLIYWDTQARDTHEQAERLKSVVGKERFALITWAGHMPRALLTFKRLHLNPVPVPMAFAKRPESWAAAFWPDGNGLLLTQRAIHEYVGILWLLVRDRLAALDKSGM
ncbi:MAG: YdcF family protein [Desulfomonile tiedjei]|uniref:YdcF family protein n=1 Tax=Desulfomonile tiedjei TaxID=2358 RepID=A0A9D6Z1N8_9BACT|nr:YdcF family protein [Desulfomonile tiedjei]